MVTDELIKYIKDQNTRNVSKDLIISQLSLAGWRIEDINEGIAKVFNSSPTKTNSKDFSRSEDNILTKQEEVKEEKATRLNTPYKVDPYRESIEEDETESNSHSAEKDDFSEKKEPKIWTPSAIKPLEDEKPIKHEDEKPIRHIEPEELPNSLNKETSELPEKLEVKKEEIDSTNYIKSPIPPKDIKKEGFVNSQSVKESEGQNITELQKELERKDQDSTESSKALEQDVIVDKVKTQGENLKRNNVKGKESNEKPLVKDIKSEENEKVGPISNFPSKPVKNKLDLSTVTPPAFIPIKPADDKIKNKNDKDNNLSKMAMISSYSKDYKTAGALKKEVSKKEKKKKRKKGNTLKISIIIIVIIAVIALVFALINIPKVKATLGSLFIKENHKTLLLNTIPNFTSLKSYKVTTHADLSIPLLANIKEALANQDVSTSTDKDWIMFDMVGDVSRKRADSAPVSKYDVSLKSSLLKDTIQTKINSSDGALYVNIPDLSFTMGDKAPIMGVVSIPKNKLNKLKSLLPKNMESDIDNLDLSKIFPDTPINYLKTPIPDFFKNFIMQMNLIKKGQEDINGTKTYHYSIDVQKQAVKEFLTNILDIYMPKINGKEKTYMNNLVDSVSINSFDIWIGKKDQNIYQYSFTMSAPLSKIFNLNDKGLTNKDITFDWKSTYSDLNVPNTIVSPANPTTLDNFMEEIKDINLRNSITSFVSSANLLKEASGDFGSKSNNGSCTNPTKGSLFYPDGYPKGATQAVSSISSVIKNLISQSTNGSPLCYSNSKAWAVAAPRLTDSSYYLCIDSTGKSAVLTNPISGPVCK